MPGLIPGIHVFCLSKATKTRMAGTPAMTNYSRHRMKSDDVAIEIGRQRDIAVLANREFVLDDATAGVLGAACGCAAILCHEIDHGAARADRRVVHLRECARRAAGALGPRK